MGGHVQLQSTSTQSHATAQQLAQECIVATHRTPKEHQGRGSGGGTGSLCSNPWGSEHPWGPWPWPWPRLPSAFPPPLPSPSPQPPYRVRVRLRRPLSGWLTRPAPGDGWRRGGASIMTLGRSEGALSPLGSSPSHWLALGRLQAAVPASWRSRQAVPRGLGAKTGCFLFPIPDRQRMGPSLLSGAGQWKVTRTPKVRLRGGRF